MTLESRTPSKRVRRCRVSWFWVPWAWMGSYFEHNICKGPYGQINNLHHHLTNNAILNVLKSRTLNSPSFFGLYTCPQGIKWNFLLKLNSYGSWSYHRMHLIIMAALTSFCAKIKVLSAYCRLRDVSEGEPGKPDKSAASFEFSIIICNLSVIRTNKRGERGPLVLDPFYRQSPFLVSHWQALGS